MVHSILSRARGTAALASVDGAWALSDPPHDVTSTSERGPTMREASARSDCTKRIWKAETRPPTNHPWQSRTEHFPSKAKFLRPLVMLSTADYFYLIGSSPRHSHIACIFPSRIDGRYGLSKALSNLDSAHADCCSLPHPWFWTHNMERKDLDDPWSRSRCGWIGNNRCDGALRKPDPCRMQRGLTRVMVPLLVFEFASPSCLTNCVDGTVAAPRVRDVGGTLTYPT